MTDTILWGVIAWLVIGLIARVTLTHAAQGWGGVDSWGDILWTVCAWPIVVAVALFSSE